jgi:hypothetical protein
MDDIEDLAPPPPARPYEVISASIRTDIPACFLKSFLDSLRNGFIDVPNPAGFQARRVDLTQVKVIAWWSKNYKFWIKEWLKEDSVLHNFKHYFNFTINGENTDLERVVSKYANEIPDQLRFLVSEFGSHALNVRFDPVVFYKSLFDEEELDNLEHFEDVVELVAEVGLPDLTFSFCVPHKHVVTRFFNNELELIDLSVERKKEIIRDRLLPFCEKNKIILRSCCDDRLLTEVKPSACIDAEKIHKIYPLKSKAKGKQRPDCKCLKTFDVGTYGHCPNDCVYCYANKEIKRKRKY